MPASVDILPILRRYRDGYFPMYDNLQRICFWDRWPVRGIIPINANTLARARRLKRRGAADFEIRRNSAVRQVIRELSSVRENSWVRAEIVTLYQALHEANLLRTIEAWSKDAKPQLVGALLGLVLPGVFVAETMYGIASEASKICLCQLIEDCAAAGFTMIDVQTPHDLDGSGLPKQAKGTAHPCLRLGEQTVSLAEFLDAVKAAWEREMEGDLKQWLALAASHPTRAKNEHDPARFLVPRN